MYRPAFVLLLLFGWIGLAQLHAQQPDLQFSFIRQNNFTYAGLANLNFHRKFDKYRIEWNFHHDHLLSSSRKDQPFVQFYIHNSLWQFYDFNERISAASWIETDQFFNSQNQRYSAYVGAAYRFTPNLELVPLIGYAWDYRSGILDQGISPALRFRGHHRWKSGLTSDNFLFLRYKDLSPRQQRNGNLRSYWTQNVGEVASVTFGLEAGTNELDDYRLNSVERIISDTISPRINLHYQIRPGLFWDTDNQFFFTNRRFAYQLLEGTVPEFNDLSFNQTEFRTLQKLSFSRKKVRAFLTYSFEYIVRRYDLDNNQGLPDLEFEKLQDREKQKDYLRNLHTLEFYMDWQVFKRHQLILTGSNRYLQYDTPSETNFDDHDELSYGIAGEWRSRWSRKFSTSYKLSGNFRQYAFLLSERSQDNYTQYALRLDFRFRWEPIRKLTFKGEQFLYVTYNIKDFEDRNRTNRSTRNLETRLEVQYRPNRRLQSKFSFYRKETHVSYIKWETFTETTLDTNTIYILQWDNQYETKFGGKKGRLYLNFGYKHFSQIRRQNSSMTNLANVLVPINIHIRTHQTGPITGIQFRMRAPATLELSVWWQYQIQDYKYQEIDKFTSLSASYREADLLKVTTAFRPFFGLKAGLWIGGGQRPPRKPGLFQPGLPGEGS